VISKCLLKKPNGDKKGKERSSQPSFAVSALSTEQIKTAQKIIKRTFFEWGGTQGDGSGGMFVVIHNASAKTGRKGPELPGTDK